MNNDKARAGIYIMAAFYLAYLAFQMFGARNNGDETKYMIMLVFTVLFILVAVGLVVFAIMMLKKGKASEESSKESEEKE